MVDLSTAGSLVSMQWWTLVHEFIFTEWALTSNVQRLNRCRGAKGDSSPLKCLFLQGSCCCRRHGHKWGRTHSLEQLSLSRTDEDASSPKISMMLEHAQVTCYCTRRGVSNKPTLSAWPSSLISIGERVTLKCQSQLGFEVFRLFKENEVHILEFQNIIFQHSFDINPMTRAHAGTYRCQGFEPNLPHKFSEISEPLLIIVTGLYRKPSLLALPAPPIKSGAMMTLKCCSEAMFETFILVVNRKDVNEIRMYLVGKPYAGGSQANISLTPVTSAHAGTYRCYSSSSQHSYVWSDPSDPLDMVVTVPDASNSSYHFNLTQDKEPGIPISEDRDTGRSLPKPVIRAEPGSVVANGSQVTIICEGTPGAQNYYLYQIRNQSSLQRLTLMKPGNIAKFLIPIIQWSHAGRYLCFYHEPPRMSKKSNALELVVTGYLLPKPMLSAMTSLVVTSGENMTFQCASRERYNGFVLTKEDEKFSRLQDSQYIDSTKQFQALFHIGPVTVSHTGTFRCYGYKNSTYMWSNPSDSLEIHIAGQLPGTPTLSVYPGTRMSSGEDVTLLCQSLHQRDSFLLSKEGTAHSLLYLRSVLQDKLYQAKFFMRNVTFDHGGTYKCYSSKDLYPYMLSYPSKPVELVVSGSPGDPNSFSEEPIPTSSECPWPLSWELAPSPGCLPTDSTSISAAAIHEENLYERKKILSREMPKVSVHRATGEALLENDVELDSWTSKRAIPAASGRSSGKELEQEDSDGRHDSKGKNARIKAVGDPKIQEEKQETACKVLRVLTGKLMPQVGKSEFLCVRWESTRECAHLVHPSFLPGLPTGSQALTRLPFLKYPVESLPTPKKLEPGLKSLSGHQINCSMFNELWGPDISLERATLSLCNRLGVRGFPWDHIGQQLN
ncbi:leukocyte immunoglobulin-like receptor subfamily B member 3A [Arvicola amphibius]|uniref:leukocyte immunoglobulin-like receptor subfamily B member 3A n=1 Tax=Arvicola amphibius TaxID=1047088 RepID=UPI001C0A1832|nr:leukocyte immunoglobulin-like receptor subfamily B member 3A [Arvicola amphibius]